MKIEKFPLTMLERRAILFEGMLTANVAAFIAGGHFGELMQAGKSVEDAAEILTDLSVAIAFRASCEIYNNRRSMENNREFK